jgi:hypothetical protein
MIVTTVIHQVRVLLKDKICGKGWKVWVSLNVKEVILIIVNIGIRFFMTVVVSLVDSKGRQKWKDVSRIIRFIMVFIVSFVRRGCVS